MKVELSLRAVNLENVAGFGMTAAGTVDAFCVVTQIATQNGQTPRVLGKTEVVENNLSPKWAQKIVFDYELGTPSRLAVSVFHHKSSGESVSMGAALFDVGNTLGCRGSTKAKKVKGGGTLYATMRQSEGSGSLRLKFRGEKLKNVEGWIAKSDPFFELYRNVNNAGGDTWELVHRSKVVKDNLNPEWNEEIIEISLLCGGDFESPIRVKVFDHERSGDHVPMGQFDTSMNQLAENVGGSMTLDNKGKEVGTIVIEKAEVAVPSEKVTNFSLPESMIIYKPKPTFVNYVNGGCKLSVVVAIDYTGSNGNPMEPGTLHYLDPDGGYNDYQKAIKSIVSILSQYDNDQKFPVFGFGAKYDGEVRHCFQCGSEPEAEGVDGVLVAYREVFSSGLIMSRPTDFTQVIDVANKRSRTMQEEAEANGKQAYTILLILSDGAVADAQATMEALESSADAPLSIVIVGLGDEDFSDMHFLDDAPEKFGRDMVQFVQFNQHSENSSSLTSATLREIPDQLVSYFQNRGIDPLPPVEVDEEEIVVGSEEDEEEIDLSLDVGEDEIVVSGGGVNVYNSFDP